ncbi:tRNA pseudouridine(38-40) synthase TruA [Inediibacterium massiliense]|uniref:tRNA pseudouridine(38-40) synthase TruA n=1 Tax=Inediibacterium massiliense TaxID=1658111 RepID=UPI0006B5079A|nr:tRNA pseudouridine(38-40) synthase TruA [Inediibacterium massiliense]
MKNVKMIIEYDGTNFYGWQKQKNARTVQEEIEKALERILKKNVKINGSGRTDAGVHALGQVANFCEDFTIPVEKIPIALNSILPEDISITAAKEENKNFHARYDAIGKKYIYKIYNGSVRKPIFRNYSYFVPHSLNIEAMERACEFFIGEYDFKGFMSSGSSVIDTKRIIYEMKLYKKDEMIILETKGNGFLYNMVRIIAGTLIDVGKEKINYLDISDIIKSGNRKKAGHTAPPQGLYLSEVYYNL